MNPCRSSKWVRSLTPGVADGVITEVITHETAVGKSLGEGHLRFVALARPCGASDGVIDQCLTWIAYHYDVANPVSRMVGVSGLPERTFKRRFKAATGYTPIDYIQTLRVEETKQLLEATDLPTDRVGSEVGYGDPVSFRRIFRKKARITPGRYRQKFRKSYSIQ